LADVPAEILEVVAAVIDGGELPGTPSTVLDLTEPEPRVLREGVVPAADALARVAPRWAE
jgi:tRNA A37 threonylcarbamoyladenosine synthetase subunit TsaC/SUA5/YrdC